jgi:hypothetical protein
MYKVYILEGVDILPISKGEVSGYTWSRDIGPVLSCLQLGGIDN